MSIYNIPYNLRPCNNVFIIIGRNKVMRSVIEAVQITYHSEQYQTIAFKLEGDDQLYTDGTLYTSAEEAFNAASQL